MVKTLIHTDTRYPVNRKIIRRAVQETFAKNHITTDAEVSVAVIGERKMKELTDKYLHDGKKHEILSFALEDVLWSSGHGFVNTGDGKLRLGDVVLCWPQVLEAARRDDVLVDDEVYDLTCHGVEHLLGKHHE